MSSWRMNWCTPPVSGSTRACVPGLATPWSPSSITCAAAKPGLPGKTGSTAGWSNATWPRWTGFLCVSRSYRKERVGCWWAGTGPAAVASPGGDGLPGAVTRAEITARAVAPGPLNIIFVANLIPRKGLHTLLAALASLPRRDDWRLTVAGSLEMDTAYVEDHSPPD